jgi:hypothetical protein
LVVGPHPQRISDQHLDRHHAVSIAVELIVALLLVPAAICCVAAGMIAGLGGS